jgi:hypothetical protein
MDNGPSNLTLALFSVVVVLVGSFCFVQLLANLGNTASFLGTNCQSSVVVYGWVVLINIIASLGMGSIGRNLLCHRYLLEKARVMVKL